MAGHDHPFSLRQAPSFFAGKDGVPYRPGKTAEDKRIGAWASKAERNARQAAYRDNLSRPSGKK